MSFRSFLHEAGQATRANIAPGLVLQAIAASLLAAYYFQPSLRPGFEWVAGIKQEWGYAYSALATAISGGLVPFLYLWARGSVREGAGRALVFYLAFWAVMGMEVDLLYRLQGLLFGQGSDAGTLIPKVMADQFLFTPFISTPQITLAYLWKSSGYSFARMRPKLTSRLFLYDMPCMVVSAWLVWTPAVSIIYALPASLQIPMFSLVLCFWSLLIEVINARRERRSAAA